MSVGSYNSRVGLHWKSGDNSFNLISIHYKLVINNDKDKVQRLPYSAVGDKLADMVETTDFGIDGKSATTVFRDSQIPVFMIATGQFKGSE